MLALQHDAKLAIDARRIIEHAVAAIRLDEHAVGLLALGLQRQHFPGDEIEIARGGSSVSREVDQRCRRGGEEALPNGGPLPDQPVRKRIGGVIEALQQVAPKQRYRGDCVRRVLVAGLLFEAAQVDDGLAFAEANGERVDLQQAVAPDHGFLDPGYQLPEI